MMSDYEFRTSRRLFAMLMLVLATGLGLSRSVVGQVQTDLVFLMDGSGSVEQCLFEFQKEAITKMICGGDCDNCVDTYLPHDGSLAISVIVFSGFFVPEGAETYVELTILDSPQTAETVCTTLESIPWPGTGATTQVAGLNMARQVLEDSTTGGDGAVGDYLV